MKKLVLSLSLLSLLGCSAAFADTTATTDPVGFISETVYGGTLVSPRSTFIAPTLTQPISFQGTIASISGGSNVISVTGGNWSPGTYVTTPPTYYVEVFSATKPGAFSDITASATGTVTTAENLNAFAAAGDSIRIRKHITIGDFLGVNNSSGLQGGNDISVADEVIVFSGAVPTSYWYYDGSSGGSAGWVDLNFNPSSGQTILPHDGVLIKRKFAGNVIITSTGTVKTGNTFFPIFSGVNVVGTIAAAGLTLDSSGLYNGTSALTASSDISTADELLIFTNGNVPNSFWYYDGTSGGSAGWVDLNFNASGSFAIAPGSAFIIKRKFGAPFNWTVPVPTTY